MYKDLVTDAIRGLFDGVSGEVVYPILNVGLKGHDFDSTEIKKAWEIIENINLVAEQTGRDDLVKDLYTQVVSRNWADLSQTVSKLGLAKKKRVIV